MRRPVRSDRLILIAVGLLLLAASAVYYVLRHPEPLNLGIEADKVVLTVLAITMGLLIIGLLFVLLRNLIKLLVERRRQVLGSRFRTKLVFIFLVLVLLPSVALFYAAATLIQQTNESLFSDPLEQVSSNSKSIVDSYNKLVRSDCARFSKQIAREIGERRLLEPERASELAARAQTWLQEFGLDFVAVYSDQEGELRRVLLLPGTREAAATLQEDEEGGSTHQGAGASGQGSDVQRPSVRLIDIAQQAIARGESSHRLDRIGALQRASAVAIVRSGSPFAPAGTVIAGRYVAPDAAEKTDKIDRAVRNYKQALKRQPDIRRVYVLLFAILTLLVLFAATWSGFYLARQITVPIQALAEGTRAISSGNLDYRVTAQAGDEIGFLIESFNSMTEELRSNRTAIEASRLEITSSYQQLEERRQYIEQLLENVPAAVISVDGRGHVTTMNREAYRILKLDPDRPNIGLRAGEVLSGDEMRPLVEEIENLPRQDAPSHVQEFELSVEGRPLHLAARISSRRDPEGRYQGALIVMEDLTPLIRAQKTAAWREVARRIAHEIKNPLTPIQLSAQRILKKFHEGAPEYPKVVEEGVTTIVKEVSTLQMLVDEFSRFARMPAVAPAWTDPNQVAETALSLYDGMHAEIVFRKDLETSLPAIRLDPDQMKRVLVNLIDNAIAAMDGKGTITLRTRLIPRERLLRVEVEDTGPGIAPENKERLFVPYFSTKKRGTGLGLAIVNRIVSDHNGFIRVEDNLPRGARFVIDLPA